ncbi:MAG: excinuclease ABC subunit C [Acidobacteria bacterium RIFCSPLOWO2_02_FULL_68_18]|nr:MAG: excinuclease ABC subunit C [Acidobacteria bacterium RIFCSPLOWO2_02_FULL_68_18]OFW48632.1 MAG: excinuclease ABC subunit C [Acidobacteria bacterium RIFCSPLOWO2_12_FULL_68_19]
MPIHDLKEQIARLPEQPGVYLWGNAAGETIYVGKARALRDRVRSYTGAAGLSPRHDALLDEIASLEVIVTDSVMEALALENNLIKQRRPKYNILLRDDKNYPYLQLTTSEACPRILVARRVEKGDDFYAGPFLPAKLARKTMALAHRLFGIRSCSEVITGRRGRPCLEHDIKRCIAPCVAEICSHERYAAAVENAKLLLAGRTGELADTLQARMQQAADAERYEEAAQLRDALRTVQTLRDREQKVATPELGDRDVFGLKIGPSGGAIQLFAVRGGRVIERVELGVEPGLVRREAEVLQAALQEFYGDRVPPADIHLPFEIEDAEALGAWLSNRAGRRVRVTVPLRGDKRALVELATRNAELSYRTRFNEATAAHFEALETLRSTLGLPAMPRRIECFDISTIQGSETVASMVVCDDGRMKKSEYRKFRIKGLRASGLGRQATRAQGQEPKAHGPTLRALPDDFAAMREVVQRRYRKVMEEGGPFPALIVIDGGKGQVTAAYDALESIGLGNLVAVGIAKREELLFTRDRSEPIALAEHDPALLLLERIRDEAHRFAVAFHRKARSMRDLRSELDTVPGIGPRRRRALLTAFGSLAGVRRATREELGAVIGPKAAAAAIDYFAKS